MQRPKVLMLKRNGDERLSLTARLTSSSLDIDGTASSVYASDAGQFPFVRVDP